jgi:hypothetical protein
MIGTSQKTHSGTVAATESRDTTRFQGDVADPNSISGGFASTESRDTFAASGTNSLVGAISATETRDTLAMTGTSQKTHSGTMAATEIKDTTRFQGANSPAGSITGGFALTESRDTLAASGTLTRVGAFQLLEVRDAAAFNGFLQKLISGSFAATESRDVCLILGDGLGELAVGNDITLRDANTGIGVSPQAEWRSGAPVGGTGTLLPTAIGRAPSTDNFSSPTANRQARLLQAIADTPAGSDILPGWISDIDVKNGDWVWAYSRTAIVADTDNPIGQGDVAPVGQSLSTLGNQVQAPPPIPEQPDLFEFSGTVVHPE